MSSLNELYPNLMQSYQSQFLKSQQPQPPVTPSNTNVISSFQNNTQSNLPQNNIPKVEHSNRFFGNEEFLNFGKHKLKTVYDLANEGNYNYLEWLSSNECPININPNMLKHIETVCLNKSNGKWIRDEKDDLQEKSIVWVHYIKQNDNFQNVEEGPMIKTQRCLGCNKTKHLTQYTKSNSLCNYCLNVLEKKNKAQEQRPKYNTWGNNKGYINNPTNQTIYK